MPGGIDPEYVRARRVLFDALDALTSHLEAVILVGAQAVYLHTGDTDLAVAPHTTDADLALDPEILTTDPNLDQIMIQAGFVLQSADNPGIWTSKQEGINVDLLVPHAVSGGGRRGARIKGHSHHAARKTPGLEGVLVDKRRMPIESLEIGDGRRFVIWVAGPTALLVAKLYKLGERQGNPSRLDAKDALDIYRLLQSTPTQEFVDAFVALNRDERSMQVTREAIVFMRSLFTSTTALGSQLAAQAVEGLADPDEVAQSCTFLANDLLTLL
jgi:hypothetical protein